MDKDANENITQEKQPKRIVIRFGYFLGICIVLSGVFLYYLIYTNSKQIEDNVLAQSTNTTQNTFDSTNVTVAEMISDVIPNGNEVKNSTVTTTDASSRKVQNEEIIVLYNGLILDTGEMKEVDLKFIESTNEEKEKYVITYYNYENFSKKESGLGSLSTQVFDGLQQIDGVGKVAISESYEAIPRQIQVVNAIPTIITDKNKLDNYDSVKAIITDLDGNGTEEYILTLANKTTGYSKICFVDAKGENLTDLAYIEKSKWDQVSAQAYYLSISNIEIVDIDNDGTMEILIELPKYEGEPSISLLKYKNGDLIGEKNKECSLLP